MRKLLAAGALAAFLAALACTSITVQQDGTLESVKTRGTAKVLVELDAAKQVKKVEAESDGKNMVPIVGGLVQAIQDLGGRFLGGGGSNTTVIQVPGVVPAEEPEPEPGG